jgi:RNA polymerase sigma-70 factor (sigma-E family)
VSLAKAAVVGWEPERVTADDALVALYREHATRLVGMLTVYVGSQAAAEDLAQEAFLRTYRAWERVRDEDRAAAYLYKAAFNLARSGFRRRLVALRHRPEPTPAVRAAVDDVVLRDDQRAVVDALRNLPARQRECLVLRFYADLSESEIASTLAISPNSVKTHVRRGLAALEARLEERR